MSCTCRTDDDLCPTCMDSEVQAQADLDAAMKEDDENA